MKLKFKLKKGLGLLGATIVVVAGCTSEDVNYDIPVNSNELIDQNVVYKSETTAVDIDEKPSINSSDIANADTAKETKSEGNADILVATEQTEAATAGDKTEDKVENKSEDKTTSVATKTSEPADAVPAMSEVKSNTEVKTESNSEDKTEDKAVNADNTVLDVEAEIAQAKAEAEANAKLMAETKPSSETEGVKSENKVIVPPPAYSDETVNFTQSSYRTATSDDDEFARAVAEAEARRNAPSSARPVEQTNDARKDYSRAEKMKMIEDTISKSKSSVDSAVATIQKIRDNNRKSYKLNVSEIDDAKERNITFLSTVIYHSNAKADISTRDERALKNVANFAKKRNALLRIVGNSSSRSKNMKEIQNKIANFDLSILRAQKVRDTLIKYGVPSENVFISAVSDTEKVAEENMPINEAVNRRTEVYITY